MTSFDVKLMHKGKTWVVPDVTTETSVEEMRIQARRQFGLSETAMIKLLHKGKVIGSSSSTAFPSSVGKSNKKSIIKVMVVATEHERIGVLNSKRSDPTVRGFDQEKKPTSVCCTLASSAVWGPDYAKQDANYKFCRFEECSWQSFGHRAASHTNTTNAIPHAFAARQLLEKLATDPGVRRVVTERELVVGTLGEMDPIDDRVQQQMKDHHHHNHGSGAGSVVCLLGYNTNHGTRIDVKLRRHEHDLTFLPYPQLVTTLLHELSHNWVGDHDVLFWSNYGQMRVEYLYAHAQLTATGYYANGTTTAQLAGVTEYTSTTTSSTKEQILSHIGRGVLAELATEMVPYGIPLPAVTPAVQRRCHELLEKDDLRISSNGDSGSGSGSGQKLGTGASSAATATASGGALPSSKRSLALAAAERRAQKNNENVKDKK